MSRPGMPSFAASLAGPIGAFLQYKRALGRKYGPKPPRCTCSTPTSPTSAWSRWNRSTARLIDAFLASRPRERARSYNHLVGVTRRFFDWASTQGMVERNPVNACVLVA